MFPLRSSKPFSLIAIVPNSYSFFQKPSSIFLFVAHVENRMVFELHGKVIPHPAHHIRTLTYAVTFWFTYWSDSPRAITCSPPSVRRNFVPLPIDCYFAGPSAILSKTLCVEDDSSFVSYVLIGFSVCAHRSFPDYIH